MLTSYNGESISYDAIRNHPPEDNVRRVIVKENIHGDAVGVDYECYPKEDPLIGEIAFRTTTPYI